MDMINILGDMGLTYASDILQAQGRIRYLKDWDKNITDALKARTITADSAPVVDRPSRDSRATARYRLTLTEVPATRARRFDYAGLKAQRPTDYQRYVSVAAADSPLTLTFPRAAVWNGLRSEGWQGASRDYAEKKAGSIGSLVVEARQLSDIRLELQELANREKTARMKMANLIMEKDRTIRPYTHQDGFIRVSQSALRQSIDLESAERNPELRRFISYYDVKPFTRVWFRNVENESEEGY